MAFALLNRFFGRDDLREAWRPLYSRIVEAARQPRWYIDGAVADTIDGRFEMICLIASLPLIRMEALGPEGAEAAARLTEVLVEDMEGQVREIGFGDQVIGKRMGELMSAFGGRLGAYRAGLQVGDLTEALTRNLYRGETPAASALAYVSGEVLGRWGKVQGWSLEDLRLKGLPA